MDNDLIRDNIKEKVQKYGDYISRTAITAKIDANIHFIKADGSKYLKKGEESWATATTKSYMEYQGYGEHNDMANFGFAEKNEWIIRKILCLQQWA